MQKHVEVFFMQDWWFCTIYHQISTAHLREAAINPQEPDPQEPGRTSKKKPYEALITTIAWWLKVLSSHIHTASILTDSRDWRTNCNSARSHALTLSVVSLVETSPIL
jgi:hypothetical protein